MRYNGGRLWPAVGRARELVLVILVAASKDSSHQKIRERQDLLTMGYSWRGYCTDCTDCTGGAGGRAFLDVDQPTLNRNSYCKQLRALLKILNWEAEPEGTERGAVLDIARHLVP
eukprot:678003-Prorocentrum_minimum.AAC.1